MVSALNCCILEDRWSKSGDQINSRFGLCETWGILSCVQPSVSRSGTDFCKSDGEGERVSAGAGERVGEEIEVNVAQLIDNSTYLPTPK